ncbi:hypothetical protein A3860_33875 [Niastella vici]|uniref:Uncharacterized protein n=2 Tax=Niastella vici TaxID=1703345 RepID=A0A1V9FQ24_9BACT|nr:hypothetical protein A3860_33875 [Niastella vici]
MDTLRYLFPFVFVGMWILVTFILSKKGWADLVASYETNAHFSGERVGVISATINNANYKNSLVLKYNEEGLYLRPIFLFRLFHKPILIPWKEIKEVRSKKILLFPYKELIIGHPFVAAVSINNSVFNKIENSINTYSIPPAN